MQTRIEYLTEHWDDNEVYTDGEGNPIVCEDCGVGLTHNNRSGRCHTMCQSCWAAGYAEREMDRRKDERR